MWSEWNIAYPSALRTHASILPELVSSIAYVCVCVRVCLSVYCIRPVTLSQLFLIPPPPRIDRRPTSHCPPLHLASRHRRWHLFFVPLASRRNMHTHTPIRTPQQICQSYNRAYVRVCCTAI